MLCIDYQLLNFGGAIAPLFLLLFASLSPITKVAHANFMLFAYRRTSTTKAGHAN